MYDSLKFSIATDADEDGDHDVFLVVMDHQVPPRFEPTVIKANERIGVWTAYTYVPASSSTTVTGWHVGGLATKLGNPTFTINGVALHVTGDEDDPRIQVRFNKGTEMEEVALIGRSPRAAVEVDAMTTPVGPQIYPVATVGPGNGGGAQSGGQPMGAGGGATGYPTGPVMVPASAFPREDLDEKPKALPEPLQFVPGLHVGRNANEVRVAAEDGDRRVEITIETDAAELEKAITLATAHLTALVNAIGAKS